MDNKIRKIEILDWAHTIRTFSIEQPHISKIEEQVHLTKSIYNIYDKNNKLLYKIENCSIIVYYNS